MAWMDDRAWCHPKFTDLSSDAFRVYWNGVSYSSGMNTLGILSKQQQNLIGSSLKTRRELVAGRLWEQGENGAVCIHNWEQHNDRQDARKQADRERKRASRESKKSAGLSADKRADRPPENPPCVSRASSDSVTSDLVSTPSGVLTRADPMWDALTAELGDVTNDRERGRRNTALKALRQSGATPSEIRLRCGRYRAAWPNVKLTALGLASNWALFAKCNGAAPRPEWVCSDCGETFGAGHLESCPRMPVALEVLGKP